VISIVWLLALLAGSLYLERDGKFDIADWPSAMGRDTDHPILGFVFFGIYFFINVFGLPAGCVLGLWGLHERMTSRVAFGAIAGSITGLWLGSLSLTVPYLGAYLSVPAFFAWEVIRRAVGMADSGQALRYILIVVNAVGGAGIGALAVAIHRRANRPRQPLDREG
jgi:hypothetical protein